MFVKTVIGGRETETILAQVMPGQVFSRPAFIYRRYMRLSEMRDDKTGIVDIATGEVLWMFLATRVFRCDFGRYTESDDCEETIRRLKGALGTEEDGDALIEVARNAHSAEMEIAAIRRSQIDE